MNALSDLEFENAPGEVVSFGGNPIDRNPGDAEGQRILAAAAEILGQGERMLGSISPVKFAEKMPVAFHASLGGHYRHCLDHFTSLVAGWERGLIDYDERQRDPRLETQPELALALTRRLRAQIHGIGPAALKSPILIRGEVSYEPGDSAHVSSTLGRELVYVIAHTIHHYALISVIARLQNLELPPGFGVAPSTLASQKRSQAA